MATAETLIKAYKRPVSVLVVAYSSSGRFLLLRRCDGGADEALWQSVTGSLEDHETLKEAAQREFYEETGIMAPMQAFYDHHHYVDYEIYPRWQKRYAPGVTQNREHLFSIEIDEKTPIVLSVREHHAYAWFEKKEAAALVFSPSNQAAILRLSSD